MINAKSFLFAFITGCLQAGIWGVAYQIHTVFIGITVVSAVAFCGVVIDALIENWEEGK